MTATLQCEVCGSAYLPSYVGPSFDTSGPKQARTRYCSWPCRQKAEKARKAAQSAARYQKKGPFVPKAIDPDILAVIRQAAAAGRSLLQIKDSLDRLDIRNQLGRQFSVTQLKRIVAGENE